MIEELLKTAITAPAVLQRAALGVLQGHLVATEPGAQPTVIEPLLSQRALAQRTGLSVATLWRYDVPGHDVGGHTRYRLSEVLAYLESDEFRRRAASLRAERKLKSTLPDTSEKQTAGFDDRR
jgi:predicted DNA-binding transcriptional regulator AlpA